MTFRKLAQSALIIVTIFATSKIFAKSESVLSNLSEIILPEFQADAIKKDGPIVDALVTDDVLWMITHKTLWKWSFLDRKVQKVALLHRSDSDNLLKVGFDGLNLYVSYTSGVYQFAIKQAKVFKYPFSNTAPVVRSQFFGSGDKFWMIANDQLIRIDRYGKTIIPVAKLTHNRSLNASSFDPEANQYWYVANKTLYRINIGTEGQATPQKILVLKKPVLSIVAKNSGVIVTTTKAVLITDANGKRLQTIPVEKARHIIGASNTGALHAYLFNDRMLETFDTKNEYVSRFKLPVDSQANISNFKVDSHLLYLVADQRIRLFAFPPETKEEAASTDH